MTRLSVTPKRPGRNWKELDEHAALMVKFPEMEHDEPYMAHVGPGKSGEIVWTFNLAGFGARAAARVARG
jgi:uncharacterized cupredoxin-like copper-binding protein